jgi:predicted metal-dependent hydrolase
MEQATHTEGSTRRRILPRTPALRLDEEVPRHWLAGSAFASQMANGVCLLFPAGERFFVRSVRRYLDGLGDAELSAQAKGFFGQEGRHARAHEDFFEVLERQGYRVRGFLRWYERIAYGGVERLAPPELALATTAALEHFTAILAELALGGTLLDDAHPIVRELLLWHAAEEIEHKAVAFDVLQRVSPSYALRMAGLAMGAACLGGFGLAAGLALLLQDGPTTLRALPADIRARRRFRAQLRRALRRGIRDYTRRDFHPNDNDNYALAAAYLHQANLAPA